MDEMLSHEELTKLLEKHTYGQEEKKMDNDPRWITDRKPNKPGKYLTTALWHGNYIVALDQFDDNEQWFLGGEVIAWMPLPPVYIPPKAEEPADKKCKNCKWFNDNLCMMKNVDKGHVMFVSSNNPDFTCGLWEQKR